MHHYLGLDLGGTNIKAGVVDEHGKLLAKVSTPTEGQGGPDIVINRMAEAAKDAAAEADIALEKITAIGIGSPGPLDMDIGVIKAAPNLPGWINIPLRDRIADATGRPAVLENDANAAAFGEFWTGAGGDKSIRHMVMFTLGTGVGSGIIIEGRLLHGAQDEGAEAGHMIMVPDGRPCGCGQRGCLETYASASRVAIRAQEAVAHGQISSLKPLYEEDPEQITSKTVFEHAAKGDRVSMRVVDDAALYLGIACVNICRILDPQMIVFAGGMIAAGDFLFDKIRAAFDDHTWSYGSKGVQIVPARLGNDAGVIGAAGVAWDAHQHGRIN